MIATTIISSISVKARIAALVRVDLLIGAFYRCATRFRVDAALALLRRTEQDVCQARRVAVPAARTVFMFIRSDRQSSVMDVALLIMLRVRSGPFAGSADHR